MLEGILLVLLFVALLTLIFFDVIIMPNYAKKRHPKDICVIDNEICVKGDCKIREKGWVFCGYHIVNHRKIRENMMKGGNLKHA